MSSYKLNTEAIKGVKILSWWRKTSYNKALEFALKANIGGDIGSQTISFPLGVSFDVLDSLKSRAIEHKLSLSDTINYLVSGAVDNHVTSIQEHHYKLERAAVNLAELLTNKQIDLSPKTLASLKIKQKAITKRLDDWNSIGGSYV